MVLIDVFRATSVITTALGEGVAAIKPVKALGEALHLSKSGRLIAAERQGQKVPEADLGNSPLPFLQKAYQGYKLVLTTSNGTFALQEAAEQNATIWIGSFLNADFLVQSIMNAQKDVLLLCAGRHGHLSLEDSMLAGYLLWQLWEALTLDSDAALSLLALYQAHRSDWQEFVLTGTHGQYLKSLGKGEDMDHALSLNLYPVLPVYHQSEITLSHAI